MIGVEPTTVQKAGAYVAQYLGLSWPRDREAVLAKINDFRDMLYHDPNLRMFDNVFECIAISEYRRDCIGGDCGSRGTFQGFVLPEHLVSVAAAWAALDSPLDIRSRWRETHHGFADQDRGERISLTETATQMATERPLAGIGRLKMFASRPEDQGKEVLVDAITDGGAHRRIVFKLVFDQWVESREAVVRVERVVLPPGRAGTVVLAEAGTLRVLSIYEPWEDVPLYRLFRITSQCPSGQILIQGVRRFREVTFDHDVVEIGSRTILRHAAEHLRYGVGTTEKADNAKSQGAYNLMVGAVQGLLNRSRGEAKRDPHPFAGRVLSPSNVLPGYRRP